MEISSSPGTVPHALQKQQPTSIELWLRRWLFLTKASFSPTTASAPTTNCLLFENIPATLAGA